MTRFFILFFLLFLLAEVSAQPRFNTDSLNYPELYGPVIRGYFKIDEIKEFHTIPHHQNTIFLENGFRKAAIINENDWISIKDQVTAREVTIIFSKYPLRKGVYHEIYPLLCERLKVLFTIDPELNDTSIRYRIILQTSCPDDHGTSRLFHGIRITYDSLASENNIPEDSIYSKPVISTRELMKFLDIPNTVSDSINKLDDELLKLRSIRNYMGEMLKQKPVLNSNLTSPEIRKLCNKVDLFIKQYSILDLDSTIYRVFNRNTSWDSILVIVDWTGSMYRYGADILKWHLLNFSHSPIRYFVIFNDGDDKTFKEIGKTGGIYNMSADDPEKLFLLYHYVMLKGNGMESEENDIEAILKGIELYPAHKDLVLIADNSCIRDLKLYDQIQEPVKVILCGYNQSVGANPQYVELAKKTGGSLHTIEDDIFFTETGKSAIAARKRLTVSVNFCGSTFSAPDFSRKIVSTKFYNPDSAYHFKYGNVTLILRNKGLTNLPPKANRIKYLVGLDLAGNNISHFKINEKNASQLMLLNLSNNHLIKIPEKVSNCKYLMELYLDHNKLQSIPAFVFQLRSLRSLDLSHNQIDSLPVIITRSIRILKLDSNLLTSLPFTIGSLRNMEQLDLSYNQLTELPSSICRMRKLKYLKLNNNQLTALPAEISNFTRLRILDLRNNDFSTDEIERIRLLLPKTQIEY